MNTKTKFDKDIAGLETQLADLQSELQSHAEQKQARADELGLAILAGKATAGQERQIIEGETRAQGLRAAIQKGQKDLAELKARQFAELQAAAREQFEQGYQALESKMIGALQVVYKAHKSAPEWAREGQRLVQLARQYNLEAENRRIVGLSMFWSGAGVSELIGKLIVNFRNHHLWQKVQTLAK